MAATYATAGTGRPAHAVRAGGMSDRAFAWRRGGDLGTGAAAQLVDHQHFAGGVVERDERGARRRELEDDLQVPADRLLRTRRCEEALGEPGHRLGRHRFERRCSGGFRGGGWGDRLFGR